MKLDRIHAQPNAATYTIPPISVLLAEEMCGQPWCDPFAGWNSPAQVTNDLNPDAPTGSHLDALEFLQGHPRQHFAGVLYDPPYSFGQAKEVYESIGLTTPERFTCMDFWAAIRDEITRVVKPAGKVISFGWTSTGMGLARGFRMDRILLVPHGGGRNDTICTVEVLAQAALL